MTETQKAIEAKIDQDAKDYASNGSNTNYFKNHFPKAWDARYNAYIAGRSKSLEEKEKEAIMFATWVENNGYVRFDKYYWTNDECETRLSDQQLYHKFKQLLKS